MTPLDDDELRDLLEARATRGAIDLEALVVEGRRRALAAPRESRRRAPLPSVVVMFGGVAALVAVVALVVVPLVFRPAASTGPSTLVAPTGGPSPTPIAPSPSAEAGPAHVEALTARGLDDWLTTAGATANGRVVLLEGELITDPSVDCIAGQPDCAPTVVRRAPRSIVIEPVGDIGPGPWDGSGPLAGTFALRGTDRTWAGTAPVMEFLGTVRRADVQLAWRVSDLITLAPSDGSDGFLVAGWMVRTPFHPCPSPANPYDCPTSDLLTPERVQPTHADGSYELPEIALALPSGTYDQFAPDPAPEGTGVVPRPGNFLLQRVSIPPCGPYADCYVGPEHRHWIVRARLDPIVKTTISPGGPPATSPDATSEGPGDMPCYPVGQECSR
jgi:hypothetical protein